MNTDMQRQVNAKCQQWDKESAMHFCRLAQRETARFTNVVYPTGYETVRVSCHMLGEAAEVSVEKARGLRRNGFKVVAA